MMCSVVSEKPAASLRNPAHGFFRGYRPEIDGLRAIAVLSVLIFHAGLGLPGGFVGVDVFFVISGYLITGIIIRELSEDRFTMAEFWSRRIKRILPATSVVTIATLAYCSLMMMPKALDETAQSSVASTIASANLFFWKLLDYFDERGETRPLLHMWSLAVEEQFYLFFPPMIAVLWKRGSRMVWALLLGIWILSLAGSIVGLNVARSSTYYLLPGRAWELCTGALLAFGEFRAIGRSNACQGVWRIAASWTGIGLIAAASFGYSDKTPFPGSNALPPCLGAALIIWSQSRGLNLLGRVLSWSPLTLIGKMSFSLYLWHWPILALLRYGFKSELPGTAIAAALGLTLACSLASWWFVEIPFRKSGGRFGPRRVIVAGIGVSAILSAAAGIITATDGLPGRVPSRILSIGVGTMRRDAEAPTVPLAFFRAEHPSLPTVGAESESSSISEVLFWGDSHSAVVSPLLHEIGISRGQKFHVASMHGVAPLAGIWEEGAQDSRTAGAVGKVLDAIEALKPARVVLVARWSMHLGQATDDSGGSPLEVCCRSLRYTVDRLKRAGVREIVICGEVPRQLMTPPQVAIRSWWFDFDPLEARVTIEQLEREQVDSRKFLAFAAAIEGVRVVDLAEACFNDEGIAHGQDSFASG